MKKRHLAKDFRFATIVILKSKKKLVIFLSFEKNKKTRPPYCFVLCKLTILLITFPNDAKAKHWSNVGEYKL